MKKKSKSISSPDDLNKHLQYTSPLTWIILSFCTCALIGFFVWSCVYKIKEKISGEATVQNGEVVLVINDSQKDKLAVGQKVYISEQEGEIVSFNNEQPIVSNFTLADGNYSYTIVIREFRPIDFLINRQQ